MKDRILSLLANGIRASEVSAIVGCSSGYISQLLSDTDFKESVVAATAIRAEEKKDENDHILTRVQNTEHRLLTAIEAGIGNAEFHQLVAALRVVGERNDKLHSRKLSAFTNPLGSGLSGSVINGNVHITQISLPSHAFPAPTPTVVMNESREILAIDNKPLAPMSSDGVKNIFAQMAVVGVERENKREEIMKSELKKRELENVIAEI